MKIVADANIPFLEGVFEPYAEVVYKDGREIRREDCLDADVLITRTRTRCNADLLEGTAVKMISTATIGTDHIDLPWCAEHGIEVYNAAGCNAGGVMDYVFSALYGVAARKKIPLQNAKLGIVGVGHVGKKVERAGRKLGFEILRCDPPRAEREGPEGFYTLDELLAEAQIVTIHVPLDDSTRGMCNDEFFSKIQPGAIFINAARGEIVDEAALLRARPKLGALVIDTWCNEPDVDQRLLVECDVRQAERHRDGGPRRRPPLRNPCPGGFLPRDRGPGPASCPAGCGRQEPGRDRGHAPVQLSHLHGRLHVPDRAPGLRDAPEPVSVPA